MRAIRRRRKRGERKQAGGRRIEERSLDSLKFSVYPNRATRALTGRGSLRDDTVTMSVVSEIVVPAREGRGVIVRKGQLLDIVDLEGQQVGDLLAWRRDDPSEYMSPAHTVSCNASIRLGTRLAGVHQSSKSDFYHCSRRCGQARHRSSLLRSRAVFAGFRG